MSKLVNCTHMHTRTHMHACIHTHAHMHTHREKETDRYMHTCTSFNSTHDNVNQPQDGIATSVDLECSHSLLQTTVGGNLGSSG